MSRTMSSWKEIAQYLGKGVRTVQRWERELELPVRRPHAKRKGLVLALCEEIDAWVNSNFESAGKSEVEVLRDELRELKKQNEDLRARLERAEQAAVSLPFDETTLSRWMDEALQKRWSSTVEKNQVLRMQSSSVLEMARKMRSLRSLQREQGTNFFYPSAIQ